MSLCSRALWPKWRRRESQGQPPSPRHPQLSVLASLPCSTGIKRRYLRRLQVDALMVVNCLSFVVILRTHQAGLGRNGLSGFVGFEPLEKLLLAFGRSDVAKPAISQHGSVVHLQVLRIYLRDSLQSFDGLFVVSLKELEPRHLIPDHAIARVFGVDNRQIF